MRERDTKSRLGEKRNSPGPGQRKCERWSTHWLASSHSSSCYNSFEDCSVDVFVLVAFSVSSVTMDHPRAFPRAVADRR